MYREKSHIIRTTYHVIEEGLRSRELLTNKNFLLINYEDIMLGRKGNVIKTNDTIVYYIFILLSTGSPTIISPFFNEAFFNEVFLFWVQDPGVLFTFV